MARPEEPEKHLNEGWSQRQRAVGNVPQAVLLKNLPVPVNALIDRWHRAVLRWAIPAPVDAVDSSWVLDLGCGYGRMARAARELGHQKIIGLDFEPGFCRQYQQDFGNAVRGSIAKLPLRDTTVGAAYAITAYMYLPADRVSAALNDLDACLVPGARVLILEPSNEFNRLLRWVFPSKRKEQLAVPGFSKRQMLTEFPPQGWRVIGAGCNLWATLLLPLLIPAAHSPTIIRVLGTLAARLDSPRGRHRVNGLYRLALHRWVLFEKPITQPASTPVADTSVRSSKVHPVNAQ